MSIGLQLDTAIQQDLAIVAEHADDVLIRNWARHEITLFGQKLKKGFEKVREDTNEMH